MIEDHFSEFYLKADNYSQSWQRRFLLSERVQLLALVAGALSANFGRAGLAGSVLALIIALGAHAYRLVSRADERWWNGRAGAESAKTLCWCYVVGGDPFPIGARQPEVELSRRLKEIADKVADMAPIAIGSPPATTEMKQERDTTESDRVSLYQTERIRSQMAWYRSKSEFNAVRRNTWAAVAITFQALALGLGVVVVFLDWDFDAVGIFTSCAAAAVAWSAVKQHETLARSYSVASNELAIIDARIDARGWTDWARFVNEAEEAISREHTSWRASTAV